MRRDFDRYNETMKGWSESRYKRFIHLVRLENRKERFRGLIRALRMMQMTRKYKKQTDEQIYKSRNDE